MVHHISSKLMTNIAGIARRMQRKHRNSFHFVGKKKPNVVCWCLSYRWKVTQDRGQREMSPHWVEDNANCGWDVTVYTESHLSSHSLLTTLFSGQRNERQRPHLSQHLNWTNLEYSWASFQISYRLELYQILPYILQQLETFLFLPAVLVGLQAGKVWWRGRDWRAKPNF